MLATQLRSFHAVAHEGSFTAAARALNVSQPTLTTQVRGLEKTYGVELFHRRGRGVTLTETGRTLFAIAQRIVSNQQDAVEFLKTVHGLEGGQLKIGAIGPYQVAEILSVFHKRYPGIQVSVRYGNSESVQQDVLDFQTDIAIVGQHEGHAALFTLDYSAPEAIAVVHSDHPWSKRKSVRIEDLAKQPLIRREQGSETYHAFEAAANAAGAKVNYVIELGSKEGVVAAVAQGIGMGLVSEEEYIPDTSLRRLRITNANLRMKVYVICLAERREARLIRPFLDVAEELAAQRRRPRIT